MSSRKIAGYAGFILHLLIGLLLIGSGVAKFMTAHNEESQKMLAASNFTEDIYLVAVGEIATGIVLIIPWTASLGTLLVCGFWGGTIAFHMTLEPPHDSYVMQAGFLLISMIAAGLRFPEMFSSFWWKPETQPAAK